MKKRIAILGSGMVGDALAKGFLTCGYSVVRGTREPAKLAQWQKEAGPQASVATFADAARQGEVIILAVKGTVAEDLVTQCAAGLEGKTVVDACNPIADAPPVNGVLQFFTAGGVSLMERLQARVPKAHFVKAFSCVGNAFMFKPPFAEKPTMFICGNDESSKKWTASLLAEFGWDVADMGAVEAARAIEPLCILWCIPGFRQNSWNHAFRLLRG